MTEIEALQKIRKYKLYRITDGSVNHDLNSGELRVMKLLYDNFTELTKTGSKYFNSDNICVFEISSDDPGLSKLFNPKTRILINMDIFNLTFPNISMYSLFILVMLKELYEIEISHKDLRYV